MAEGRGEWIFRMMEMWNGGDYDGFLDELGPDLEFSPDPGFPDAGTYSGEELRGWMHDWISTYRYWLTRQSMGVCSCLRDLVA